MIRYKKANKQNKPMLIEYKLLTITPYIKDDKEKLKVIAFVNDWITKHYSDFYIIYYYFKPIGTYFIKDGVLDTLYIKDKYQNKRIGTKTLKKLQKEIDKIKVHQNNTKAIAFYKKNNYSNITKEKAYLILRRDDKNENE